MGVRGCVRRGEQGWCQCAPLCMCPRAPWIRHVYLILSSNPADPDHGPVPTCVFWLWHDVFVSKFPFWTGVLARINRFWYSLSIGHVFFVVRWFNFNNFARKHSSTRHFEKVPMAGGPCPPRSRIFGKHHRDRDRLFPENEGPSGRGLSSPRFDTSPTWRRSIQSMKEPLYGQTPVRTL